MLTRTRASLCRERRPRARTGTRQPALSPAEPERTLGVERCSLAHARSMAPTYSLSIRSIANCACAFFTVGKSLRKRRWCGHRGGSRATGTRLHACRRSTPRRRVLPASKETPRPGAAERPTVQAWCHANQLPLHYSTPRAVFAEREPARRPSGRGCAARTIETGPWSSRFPRKGGKSQSIKPVAPVCDGFPRARSGPRCRRVSLPPPGLASTIALAPNSASKIWSDLVCLGASRGIRSYA